MSPVLAQSRPSETSARLSAFGAARWSAAARDRLSARRSDRRPGSR